jgi:hypothetical protein
LCKFNTKNKKAEEEINDVDDDDEKSDNGDFEKNIHGK